MDMRTNLPVLQKNYKHKWTAGCEPGATGIEDENHTKIKTTKRLCRGRDRAECRAVFPPLRGESAELNVKHYEYVFNKTDISQCGGFAPRKKAPQKWIRNYMH